MSDERAAPPELPPRYYLDNFRALASTVRERYGDVLAADEVHWLDGFDALGEEAQCLYLRLVSRVGPWFRQSRLHYPELGGLSAPIEELLEAGFIVRPDTLSADEAGALFTVAELRAAFHFPATAGGKAAVLDALAETPGDGPELLTLACEALEEQLLGPLGSEIISLLQLLFFGNGHQSLTDFVLSDLGVQCYYPYALNASQRKFENRQAVEEYILLLQVRDAWFELTELGEADELLELARDFSRLQPAYASSRNRFARLCNRMARDLERLDCPELALALYTLSDQHPARERRARVLERQEATAEALALCEDILADPWCEAELQAARRMTPRLRRKLGGGRQSRHKAEYRELQLAMPRPDSSVELAAAASLGVDWRSVHYVENTLLNGLFGLAYWEQIFAPLPGAFHHRFQRGPADMFSRAFFERREDALATRRCELAAGAIPEMLLEAYDRFAPYQSHWVNWRYLSRQLVADALAVMPAEHLLRIWDRLLFDPADNRKGFPDLVALGEGPGDYCLVEVKGPGDALQDSQKRWLDFFQAEGIPAAVAWVRLSDD